MAKKQAEPEPEIVLRRQYSGSESHHFWWLVKRCPNREIYTLGLILQDVESRVLAAVEANQPAVRAATKRRRR